MTQSTHVRLGELDISNPNDGAQPEDVAIEKVSELKFKVPRTTSSCWIAKLLLRANAFAASFCGCYFFRHKLHSWAFLLDQMINVTVLSVTWFKRHHCDGKKTLHLAGFEAATFSIMRTGVPQQHNFEVIDNVDNGMRQMKPDTFWAYGHPARLLGSPTTIVHLSSFHIKHHKYAFNLI